MLFNSTLFILGFLPVTIIGFFSVRRFGQDPAKLWVVCASLLFYATWNPPDIIVLITSITFNYYAGLAIIRAGSRRKIYLAGAIAINLTTLAYYKYLNFLLSSAAMISSAQFPDLKILMPLGISFFTFTQIAFLVDCSRGIVIADDINPLSYAFFVTYFPHLIAGPIIHHKNIMAQLIPAQTYLPSSTNVAAGISFFIIGLFKKVVIADNIAPISNLVFGTVDSGATPSFCDSWSAATAYAFQIYFDFSGYSDMAIGISLLLNIRLPINFSSPYKATSIIDFWKMWHMTLSSFLREYLYYSLGGNRKGPSRRFINLMATMLIGGLWHGANWTFIVWGGVHGAYLIINHAWRGSGLSFGRHGKFIGCVITFIAVVIAWVFFRAPSIHTAINMLTGMAYLNNFSGDCTTFLDMIKISACAVIAFFLPNSQTWITANIASFNKETTLEPDILNQRWMFPSLISALWIGTLGFAALCCITKPSIFLYYNF